MSQDRYYFPEGWTSESEMLEVICSSGKSRRLWCVALFPRYQLSGTQAAIIPSSPPRREEIVTF